MKIETDKYRVRKDAKVNLADWPTDVPHLYASEAQADAELGERVARLSALQQVLYASDRWALLVVLQGMDTSGKDGIIRRVMSGVNPQGCEVHSFKQPTYEEVHHDFLWRAHKVMPGRGRIGVFNRSYYEELVVVRVHPEFLAAQAIDPAAGGDESFWRDRCRAIVEMERHLDRSQTRVVKVLLHLSKDEQRTRLLERIEEPDKNWKVNPADAAERARWDEYMEAYGRCIAGTSTSFAPWFIVPADDKDNARLIVSEILLDVLSGMDLSYPTIDKQRRSALDVMRQTLEAEAPSGDKERQPPRPRKQRKKGRG